MRDQHVQVELIDGRLVVSIGVDTLATAVKHMPQMDDAFDEVEGKEIETEITDADKLAAAIVEALDDEEEDGTTLVHRMLDKAALRAIEGGAEGILTADEKLRELKRQRKAAAKAGAPSPQLRKTASGRRRGCGSKRRLSAISK